jgi:Spy/CpxP family protein refolding chaperone
MMKRLSLLLAVMILASAANLRADEKAAPGQGGTTVQNAGGGGVTVVGASGNRVWGGKSAAQWYIDSIDKIVHLTEAQKKAITASIEARDKAMQEFNAKNAEKLKAALATMTEAYKSKDKDAIAKAQKAYQDLYAPMHEAMKKSQSELDGILAPEQREKQQDSRMTATIKAWTDPLQLTDEQMKKLKAAYGELTKANDYAALASKLPEVIQNVLTAEQKLAIVKHRAMIYVKAMFARAKLTDEQMKSVEAMVDELAKDPNVKVVMAWQSYSKLAEKIRGLLTPEQKKALEAPYKLGAPGASVNPVPGGKETPVVVRLNEGGGGVSVVGGSGNVIWGGKTAAQWYIESIDKIVRLTEAQKKAITASIEARDKAMRDFQAQNAEKLKAAGAAMMEAYKSKDKDAVARAQKAYQDLYAPMHEAMKKSQGELDNILTPEQKEKQQESRMSAAIKAWTDPVQLSDEQMQKLKAAYGEFTKANDYAALANKLPEVIQNVLTAEQKATIAKQRAMVYVKAMFARAKLTDEQMKSVQAMVDELVKEQNFKIVMDWQSYNKLAEKIRGLLTAEQKKALEAAYSAAQGYIESIDKIVHLTDAQKKAITETIEAREKATRELYAQSAEKLKAASAALTEAWKSNDKDAIAKAQKVIEDLYAPMREAMTKSTTALDKILTPQQKQKLQGNRTGQSHERAPGAPLNPAPGGGGTPLVYRLREAVPGGGWQVILSERGETRQSGEGRRKELSEMARRIEHEAHELREAMERQPGQPQGQVRMYMPGQPLHVRPDPAIQELRSQMQELRRQVEELKAMVKKAGEKN